MADFNFTVDTRPMAESIGIVSNNVNKVSVSVTAMEAAVIAAEQEAGRYVSEKVDQGFFLFIRSQISQKVAHLNSLATSKLITLRQLALALQGIKKQMERDYHMISSRYKKLFASLDKSLQQRVYELDKIPSELSSKQYPNLINRLRTHGTHFLTSQSELIPVMQLMAAAKIKTDTYNLINSIKNNLQEQNILKAKLQTSLINERIPAKKLVFLPVIISEVEGLGGLGSIKTVHTPPMEGEFTSSTPIIKEQSLKMFDTLNWKEISDLEKTKILEELQSLCEQSHLDIRIQNEIIKLSNANKLQILNEKEL